MRILVIGSGGREHALVWKLRQSPTVKQVYAAPGNPGIGKLATMLPVEVDDLDGLVECAKRSRIDLTVVGPEQPLANGIVDLFQLKRMKIFGPTREASRLEWSKVFAKEFMQSYSIPTASFRVLSSGEREKADQFFRQASYPVVLKADGLAAGKGVVVCSSYQEAVASYSDMTEKRLFGDAGNLVLAEEFMRGVEASVLAVCDGKNYVVLPSAQDYKRALDNNEGKNTGGMGSLAPSPLVTDAVMEEVCSRIIEPALKGLEQNGTPYQGCLYVGLMLTEGGAMVVEFNSRFGDPETQVVLPLFDGDFADLLMHAVDGTIDRWNAMDRRSTVPGSAVCVIAASRGYPGEYEKGKTIRGIEEAEERDSVTVFHAGTTISRGKLVTAGGRVLGVTALGPRVEAARERAYEALKRISFDGMVCRTDIAKSVTSMPA